jgi:CheY-like chemotaxis protein
MKKINTLLLVDDDQVSNFLTQSLIEEINVAGYIHVANNGQEAIDFLEQYCSDATVECPDLILLDLNMPVMDGFEFLSRYKELEYLHHKHISIVILTSSSSTRDIEKAKEYDIVKYYLTKPITEENLEQLDKFI